MKHTGQYSYLNTTPLLFVVLLYWAFCGDIRVLGELPVDDDDDDDDNDNKKSQLNLLASLGII